MIQKNSNKLAKPKLINLHFFKKLSKHWGVYAGLHRSFHTKSLNFNFDLSFNGSHRGLTVFIQIWSIYFELELNDNRHEGEY